MLCGGSIRSVLGARWLVLAWLVGLPACDDEAPTEPLPEDPWAEVSLAVVPESSVLDLGMYQRLHLVALDESGQAADTLPAQWESSDPDIASVDGGGFVRTHGPGLAVIEARPAGASQAHVATAEISVVALRFVQVTTGDHYTCAVSAADRGYCWGINFSGQLGKGGITSNPTGPRGVAGDLWFREIRAGYQHTCAVTTDDGAYCWGLNDQGRLGNGRAHGRVTKPRPVATTVSFRTVQVGGRFSCGLTPEGQAYCWGDNRRGALGLERPTAYLPTPRFPVSRTLTFRSISLGDESACGLTLDGTAWCWGRNDVGQLGDGTTLDRPIATRVAGGIRFQTIRLGRTFSCAIDTDGIGYCWGSNVHGRLGNGTYGGQSLTPEPLATEERFQDLAVGAGGACALSLSGEAYCWGSNLGAAMGQDPATVRQSNVPMAVRGSHLFRKISRRGSHACAIGTDDLLYCWGSNVWGALGALVPNQSLSEGVFEPLLVDGQGG